MEAVLFKVRSSEVAKRETACSAVWTGEPDLPCRSAKETDWPCSLIHLSPMQGVSFGDGTEQNGSKYLVTV